MKIKVLIAVLFSVFSVSLLAQAIQVRGVVVDAADNTPLTGVSVKVANSQNITVTGINGEYTINANMGETLEFSFIGMTTQRIAVTGAVINVSMAQDATRIDEVIVVAYGVVRPEAKTGSVSTVSGTGIAETPVTSVDKMLAGKMAGVQITASSGQPGANSQIRVRGTSSVNASNEPLWVVDGIPVMSGNQTYFTNTGNAIASINPSDIESITVLKDAAAASVYGSRAANGVILVTTKRGKDGRAQFTVRAKYGVDWLANDNGFRVMTGEELLGFQRQSIINAGRDPDNPSGGAYRPLSLIANGTTDWVDHFTKGGIMQEYEINAAGGNNKGSYYSSLSFHQHEGVFYGVDLQRVTARVNADYKLANTITSGARINMAYTDASDIAMQSLYYANPAFAGITILPWSKPYNDDGTHNIRIPENSNTNPRATAEYDEQWEKQYRLLGSAYVEWKPIKSLTFKTNNAVETTFANGVRYWSPYATLGYTNPDGSLYGVLQQSKDQYVQLTTSNTITYNDLLFDDHSVRVLLGQEAMKSDYDEMYIYAPNVDPLMRYPNTTPMADVEAEYYLQSQTLLSFFGILDYNYAGKYYLQASIREDGSSLFGDNRKWGTFWSMGGSWNVHNEGFMKNQHFLNLLKLRVSYGVNGNNGINPYRAYGVYATTGYNGSSGMRPYTPENQNLSWERNLTWNAGLDFGFFNRFDASLDLYTRDTEDMLLNKTVPQTSGFSSNFVNIGKINNKGIEFKFDADIIRTKDLMWSAGFNIAFNKSKVLNLAGNEFISYSDARLRHVVGRSFLSFYLYDYYGVNPVNGEALWRTKDGELTNNFNQAQMYYAGSPEPKYIGGFYTTLDWKGFNLSAFLEFKGGNHVLIVEKRYVNSDGNQNMNQMSSGLNYWKKPGDTGVNPKPVWGTTSNAYTFANTRYLERGDYLRLKDVSLSYSVPRKLLEKAKISNLKIYVSGLNMYTFHKVDWWDPERGVNGMGSGIYPMTKSFIGGIEISF